MGRKTIFKFKCNNNIIEKRMKAFESFDVNSKPSHDIINSILKMRHHSLTSIFYDNAFMMTHQKQPKI